MTSNLQDESSSPPKAEPISWLASIRAHCRRTWFLYGALALSALPTAREEGIVAALIVYLVIVIAVWLLGLGSAIYGRLVRERYRYSPPDGAIEQLTDRWIVPFRERARTRREAEWERDRPRREAELERYRREQPATLWNINREFAEMWMRETENVVGREEMQRLLAAMNEKIAKEGATVGHIEDRANRNIEQAKKCSRQ